MTDETDRINALERIPRHRTPERDLWPGIAARLAPRRRSRYALVQFALAASLVAGLAAVFALHIDRVGTAPVTVAALDLPMTTDSRAIVKANLGLVRQAERQVRQALEQDPDSPTLRSLLASAQNQQRALTALL
jgi:hypothetical protein